MGNNNTNSGQKQESPLQTPFKDVLFLNFLVLKTAYKSLHHKKMVHKILQNYSNQNYSIDNSYHIYSVYQSLQKISCYITDAERQSIFTQNNNQLYSLYSINSLSLNLSNRDLSHQQIISFLTPLPQYKNTLKSLQINLNCIKLSKNLNHNALYILCNTIRKLNLNTLILHLNITEIDDFNPINSLLKAISPSLKNLTLNLTSTYLVCDPQHIQDLTEGLQSLQNLLFLHLELKANLLGSKIEHIQKLTQSIQTLQNLNHLSLNLNLNYLEKKKENFQNLKTLFSSLKTLKFLEIRLELCSFGKYPSHLELLTSGIKEILTLQTLIIDLNHTDLGAIIDKTQYLSEVFQNLTTLNKLELYLQSNNLGNDIKDINSILFWLKPLKSSLKKLKLDLKTNNFGSKVQNISNLTEELNSFSQLQILDLSLNYNNLNSNSTENLQNLSQGFKNFPKLEKLSIDIGANLLQLEDLQILLQEFKFPPLLSNLNMNFKSNNCYHEEGKKLSKIVQKQQKKIKQVKLHINIE